MKTRTRFLTALSLGVATVGAAPQLAAAEGAQPDGAPTAATVKLPSGPGSVRGLTDDPTVDSFSGQAAYGVPLELPGAARGFAPSVALAYSGDLGNGALGIGWSVGVASIRVSTRQGVPNYDGTDELELSGIGGGGRLVATATGEWRIEGEGNAIRIRADGAGYVAWGPDGTRYRFGVTAGGRQGVTGKIAAWMVEEVTDVAGQRVAYTYTATSGALYLAQIAWGPGDALRAVFEHATRPDVIVSHRLGFPVITSQRVSAVRVEAFGEVQRRYELAYDESFSVSRLRSVELVGRGGVDRMPPLTFEYAARADLTPRPLDVGTWRLDGSTVLVDVDADGTADLLRMTGTGHEYRLNRGGTFAPPLPLTGAAGLTLASARLADVEGRARANLIGVSSGTWRPYRLEGSAWTALGTWTGSEGVPLKGANVVVAELDGDGRVDVVQWNDTGLIVRFGQTGGFAAPVSKPRIAGTLLPASNVRWHDANGDGLTDALRILDTRLYVYLGRGDGTFEPAASHAWPFGLSLGSRDIRFADLDRDGLLDLIAVNPSDVAWYRGRAAGGFVTAARVLPKPGAAGIDTIVAIDDANGNGSEDVVWSSAAGVWALDLAGATNAGMLVGVDNGLGKRVAFTYAATTELAGADAAAGLPWSSHLPMAVPVVVGMTATAGDGDPARTTSFRVRDGFWDVGENRFGGFLTSARTVRGGGQSPDLVETTRFHPGLGVNRVLRGKPVEVKVENGAGSVVSITTNTWVPRALASLPGTSPLLKKATLSRTTIQQLEGRPAGSPLTTRVSYTADAEARIAAEVHEGRLDLTGDEKRIEHTYASDDTTWVRDLPAEERLLAADGTLVAATRTYYGDHLGERPLGQAGNGWKRRSDAYHTQRAAWITQARSGYDALGNAVSIEEGGITHAVGYDANGRNPIEERIATGTGELVWRMTWDDVLGVPTSLTAPDGAVTAVTYDGLGRQTSVASGTRAPHEVYRYHWAAPRPYGSPRPFTEVWRFDGALADVGAVPASWTDGGRWRQQLQVTNGAGEALYSATRSGADRWIVRDWTERDAMGRATFGGDPIELTGSPIVLQRPPGIVGQSVSRDALGRAQVQTLADGRRRSFQHAAATLVTTVDGLAPVTMVSDGLGRVIETRRATELTRALYDAADRVTRYETVRGSDVVVQQFVHDSLGRLIGTVTPESGARTLTYDDAGRLLHQDNAVGQRMSFTYDAAGRVLTRTFDDGTAYRYHYDVPRTGTGGFTGGRLTWVEEPTGIVDVAYDELGRVTRRARTLDGIAGSVETRFAASGLPLAVVYDGGAYEFDMAYDGAGRPGRAGTLWTLEGQDAAGHVTDERFGNGVRQHYVRDVLGMPARIEVAAPAGEMLYAVTVGRNAWGGITSLEDDDGRGLDHTATFTYDDRARLTGATIGAAAPYVLGFEFDDLQNMTGRRVGAGHSLAAMMGTYRYGEGGRSPRQLTSVVDDAGVVQSQLGYDLAGRQTSQDARTMRYNALDQLVEVLGTAGGDLQHVYGYDGTRLRTTQGAGSKRWLFPEISDEGGVREYFVSLGGRTLARVRVVPGGGGGGSGTMFGIDLHAAWLAFLGALALGLAIWSVRRRPARRAAWVPATGAVGVALVLHGCAGPAIDSGRQALVGAPQIVYFHQGVSPGPVLFTADGGAVVEERRYEPFGAPLDAEDAAGPRAPDFRALDENVLGKPVEPVTGWSFHGARWYAPESARWLSVDPPTLTPNAEKQMAEPWTLHPYQYVDQNPLLYWDPDGREKVKRKDGTTVNLPTRRDGEDAGYFFMEWQADQWAEFVVDTADGALTAAEIFAIGSGSVLLEGAGIFLTAIAPFVALWGSEKDLEREMEQKAKVAYAQGFLAALLAPDQMETLRMDRRGSITARQFTDIWNKQLDAGFAAGKHLDDHDEARLLATWDDVVAGLASAGKTYPEEDPTYLQMILDGAYVMKDQYTW